MLFHEYAKIDSNLWSEFRGEKNFEWQENAGHRMAKSMNAWQIKLQKEAGGDRGGGYK